jgi:hypothetical protein
MVKQARTAMDNKYVGKLSCGGNFGSDGYAAALCQQVRNAYANALNYARSAGCL